MACLPHEYYEANDPRNQSNVQLPLVYKHAIAAGTYRTEQWNETFFMSPDKNEDERKETQTDPQKRILHNHEWGEIKWMQAIVLNTPPNKVVYLGQKPTQSGILPPKAWQDTSSSQYISVIVWITEATYPPANEPVKQLAAVPPVVQKFGFPVTEAVAPLLHHIVDVPVVQVDPLAMVPTKQAPSAAERLSRSRINGRTYLAFCDFSMLFSF
jgi:hypothetical protein